jgi:hypothetical protein
MLLFRHVENFVSKTMAKSGSAALDISGPDTGSRAHPFQGA